MELTDKSNNFLDLLRNSENVLRETEENIQSNYSSYFNKSSTDQQSMLMVYDNIFTRHSGSTYVLYHILSLRFFCNLEVNYCNILKYCL